MTYDPTRYRLVEFIGGRILEARELLELQTIAGDTYSYGLTSMFRQGAMLNTTVTVTGNTVTFTSTDGVNPMLVFVRDCWEAVKPAEILPITLNPTLSQTTVYLNWQLFQITNTTDPTLIDPSTGDPTAQMGELILSFSATDTSSTPLASDGSQFAKNTSTIIVSTFAVNGSVLMAQPIPMDNVLPQALANKNTSGLVSLTTSTASGVAVANDDYRNTNARVPVTASVINSSVYTPQASTGATNSNGTAVYTDTNGISASKILLQAATECLEDGYNWLNNSFANLQSLYLAHQGATLGPANVHPIPTPEMVGATPLSHVGQPLALATSHPPVASMNTGGFQLMRDPSVLGAALDPGFSIQQGSTNLASLNHNGDVFSYLANQTTATPQAPLPTQSLGLMSIIASQLASHVNQISHDNPHGLAASDIDAPTNEQMTAAIDAILPVFITSNGATVGVKFSTGFTIQWGTLSVPIGTNNQFGWTVLTFPQAFATACYGVIGTCNQMIEDSTNTIIADSNGAIPVVGTVVNDKTSANVRTCTNLSSVNQGTTTVYWIAFGN